MKHPGGRPSDYKPEYCQMMLDHFNQPLYIIKKKEIASGGRKVIVEEEKPNSMPTFERFALSIGAVHNTLRNWCKEYPEFLSAYSACKDIQKNFILEHGMMGGYNAGFAKFVAINVTDLKETIVHDVVDSSIKISIDKKDSEL